MTGFAITRHICTQWQRIFLSPIDSSISKLTNHHNTTAKSWPACFFWGLFLRPVIRPRVLGCPLILLVGLYRQSPCWKSSPDSFMIRPWIFLCFVTFWVQWGLILGHFTLKIAELHCNPPLRGYAHHLTLHPYISAYGVDKKQSKWWEIQLALHCGVGSLIAIK